MTQAQVFRLVARKRVEFVIDAAVQPRLARRLHDLGPFPYTVLPALAGEGSQGTWSREGGVGAAGRYVRVLVEVDAAELPTILDLAAKLVHDGTAAVSVLDVQAVLTD